MNFKIFMNPIFCLLLASLIPAAALSSQECFTPKIRWEAEAELLIFRSDLDNLPFANEILLENLDVAAFGGLTTSPYNIYSGAAGEKVKRFDSHYYPGFRAKVIGTMIHCDLRSSLIWTNFHSNSEGTAQGVMQSANTGVFIKLAPTVLDIGLSLGSPPPFTIVTPLSTFTRAQYSLAFDQGDLLFSKKLHLYRCITLEPFIGPTFVKINQKYKQSYQLTQPIASTLLDIALNLYQNNAIRFEGIGSKAGFTTTWQFSPLFHLYGGLFGALYYGQFTVKQYSHLQATDITFPAANLPVELLNRFQDVRFAGGVQLGLEYRYPFNCDRNAFHFTASWEGNWFPDQNMFGVVNSIGSLNTAPGNVNDGVQNANKPSVIGGDLQLSGWALGVSLLF